MKRKAFAPTTVHKTFEKGTDGTRAVVLYVSDGVGVSRLTPKQEIKFYESAKAGSVLRFTSVSSTDSVLLDLSERGVSILYAHWHALGVAKNLPPEEIVLAVAKAPATLFREFHPSRQLAELRDALSLRNAVLRFYGDAVRRFKQVGRNMGIAKDAEDHPLLEEAFRELDILFDSFKADGKKGRRISLERRVEQLAQAVPECVLFNKIAGIKGSWLTAASIVAFAGGMDRFPTVASFWHYMGQHVVDGKAPKRKAGNPCTWSTKGRTAVYLMEDSLFKNKKNPWRAFYDQEFAKEFAVHAEKHPNCPAPTGHSMARAKRKMGKEILKQYFLAAKGQTIRSDQHEVGVHSLNVAAVA